MSIPDWFEQAAPAKVRAFVSLILPHLEAMRRLGALVVVADSPNCFDDGMGYPDWVGVQVDAAFWERTDYRQDLLRGEDWVLQDGRWRLVRPHVPKRKRVVTPLPRLDEHVSRMEPDGTSIKIERPRGASRPVVITKARDDPATLAARLILDALRAADWRGRAEAAFGPLGSSTLALAIQYGARWVAVSESFVGPSASFILDGKDRLHYAGVPGRVDQDFGNPAGPCVAVDSHYSRQVIWECAPGFFDRNATSGV